MEALGDSLPERAILKGFEFGLPRGFRRDGADPFGIVLRDHMLAIRDRDRGDVQNGAARNTDGIAVTVRRLLGELTPKSIDLSRSETGAV